MHDDKSDTASAEESRTSPQSPENEQERAKSSTTDDKKAELDDLTSPRNLRTTASEARDRVSVIRQFAAGSREGMFVERDAHIHGDLIMEVGLEERARPGRPRPRAGRAVAVDADEVRRVRYVYQRPLAYGQCHNRLRARHVVMLLGQKNAGKRATAIQLALDALGEGQGQILEYDEGVNLVDLPAGAWQPHAAYLVDGFLVERIRGLTPHTLRGVAEALKNADSYLILCAHPDAAPHEDVRRRFGVLLEPPPVSASILLERHLSYYAGEEFGPDALRALLAEPALKPVLQRPMPPQGADDLSRRLLRVLRGEIELDEALTGFLTAVESQVEAWFEEAGDDVAERAFRLALAAFHGARYMAVQKAAQDLAERLTPPPPPPDPDSPPPPPPSPFARRRSSRLERAQAHLEWAPEPGSSLPSSRIEVVKLDDEAFPAALLRYVWCEYDNLRADLLSWLKDHAVGRPADVRTRAAGALGALASYDVATIRDQVLIPWVNREHRSYRAAIGNALAVLIWDDAHAPDVLTLLEEWSEHRERAFRWAAARAYGEVGLRYPRQAIDQWRKILLSTEPNVQVRITDDWRLVLYDPLPTSILDTMVNFFLAAVAMPDRYRPVYEETVQAIKEWCDEDREKKRERHGTALGLPIFMVLTSLLVGDRDVDSDPETWPPAMLVLVSDDPAPSPYRATLAELFRRALNWQLTQADALAILKSWLQRVDHDTRLEGPILALLREITSGKEADARDRGRIAAYLRRWATHPRHPVQTAIRARQELGL